MIFSIYLVISSWNKLGYGGLIVLTVQVYEVTFSSPLLPSAVWKAEYNFWYFVRTIMCIITSYDSKYNWTMFSDVSNFICRSRPIGMTYFIWMEKKIWQRLILEYSQNLLKFIKLVVQICSAQCVVGWES